MDARLKTKEDGWSREGFRPFSLYIVTAVQEPRKLKMTRMREVFSSVRTDLLFDPLKISGLVEEVQIGFFRLNKNKRLVD